MHLLNTYIFFLSGLIGAILAAEDRALSLADSTSSEGEGPSMEVLEQNAYYFLTGCHLKNKVNEQVELFHKLIRGFNRYLEALTAFSLKAGSVSAAQISEAYANLEKMLDETSLTLDMLYDSIMEMKNMKELLEGDHRRYMELTRSQLGSQ